MRLLLAEDEKILSEALVAILTHNNYSVDAVYNGQDALDYILQGNYDGAILDIMMPKMDGLTVLKNVRENSLSLPILILTAKSETDDKVEGLDSGADDYLTKPFDSKELLARIRAMTRRKSDIKDNNLTFSDLILNRTKYELSCVNGVIKLHNREFQIMEMLMENPHQIIPTDRFLEKIWGFNSNSDLSIVWVYLSSLRKKLTSIGSNVQIKATRNIGYSLEESKC